MKFSHLIIILTVMAVASGEPLLRVDERNLSGSGTTSHKHYHCHSSDSGDTCHKHSHSHSSTTTHTDTSGTHTGHGHSDGTGSTTGTTGTTGSTTGTATETPDFKRLRGIYRGGDDCTLKLKIEGEKNVKLEEGDWDSVEVVNRRVICIKEDYEKDGYHLPINADTGDFTQVRWKGEDVDWAKLRWRKKQIKLVIRREK